jgi:nitronate monooxygenase
MSRTRRRVVWPKSELLRRLGIAHPIVQAPMAGGATTPALVAAVSEAGALGSLGAAFLGPDAIRETVQETRRLTHRPFAVNLFVLASSPASPSPQEWAQANDSLQPFREELGLVPPSRLAQAPGLQEQLAVVLEERVPVFSFTFGALPAKEVRRLRDAGIFVIGTATTVKEARLLEQSGVDAVVAQGSEAGGHRGTFDGPPEQALIGTLALVPHVVDRVSIPVIAAGGIMDGRGIVAALALGASAAQLGTAFLASAESGAHPLHKEAVLTRADEDRTALTRAFSGRLGRGLRNRFMVEIERRGAILPYPLQGALTEDIRQASLRAERPDLATFWAGQGAPLATGRTAREIIDDLVSQAQRVLERLR